MGHDFAGAVIGHQADSESYKAKNGNHAILDSFNIGICQHGYERSCIGLEHYDYE